MRFLTTISSTLRDVWEARHEPERSAALAEAFWRVVIVGAVLLTIGVAIYGGMRFLSVLSGGGPSLPLSGSGAGAALNRAELRATLDGFTLRKTQYESLKGNPPQIADPSK